MGVSVSTSSRGNHYKFVVGIQTLFAPDNAYSTGLGDLPGDIAGENNLTANVLGDITVGDNSYIGANAVVIKDVPPNSTVVGVPGRITKQDGKKIDVSLDHIHVLDPIMQNIEALQKRIENLEKKN